MTLTCQSCRRPARDGFYCTRHALLEIGKAGAWLIGGMILMIALLALTAGCDASPPGCYQSAVICAPVGEDCNSFCLSQGYQGGEPFDSACMVEDEYTPFPDYGDLQSCGCYTCPLLQTEKQP